MRLAIAGIFAGAWALAGCASCELDGYTPLTVALVSGSPAVAATEGGCIVYTDLTADTVRRAHEPKPPPEVSAAAAEGLRHIGASVYGCLSGTATTVADRATGAFYEDRLHFRIDGQVPQRSDGKFYYGYWREECSTIDTNLAHIGPQQECIGVAMADWQETCWAQFYAVLGHEVAHGWLGSFHG